MVALPYIKKTISILKRYFINKGDKMNNIKELREYIKIIRNNKDFKDITLKDNVYCQLFGDKYPYKCRQGIKDLISLIEVDINLLSYIPQDIRDLMTEAGYTIFKR
jgi:hypothetical protein